MLLTALIAVIFVALAILGLSLGVIFGKRTPLKGSCGSALSRKTSNDPCAACSCHEHGASDPPPVHIQM